MRELIAIVDDEPDILELVTLHLEKARFPVRSFSCARDFFAFLRTLVPDLLVLDLMLPDGNGFDICRELKQNAKYRDLPIIMLTARGAETDKIQGLDQGADDYITKPFSPKELVARVKAVLRRKAGPRPTRLEAGGILKVDPDKYRVTVEDKDVELTATEFKILRMLINRPGWVFSRDQMLEILWGDDKVVVDRTIDVHIKHLREKLGPAGGFIKNVRGIGYKLEV